MNLLKNNHLDMHRKLFGWQSLRALSKLLVLSGAVGCCISAKAQTPVFTPGHLAVLQLGDGGPDRNTPSNGGSVANPYTHYAASDILGSRQTALYINQYDPKGTNQTSPELRIAIPSTGPDGLFINGNAGTEGNLTLAGDRSVLAVTGYAGDILSITTGQQTAPSNLSYDRGMGVVDAFGVYTRIYRGGGWYGIASGKTNPRGVATDGAGNFWGCGNGYGSLFFNASSAPSPIQFQNIALTSCTKIIDDTLYATVKNSESVNLYPAGVYSFVDFFNNPAPRPNSASFLHLEVPANPAHNNCIGFDLNPQRTVAYLADATATGSAGGITKYVKNGLNWSMAYHLAIPGYNGLNSGIMTNAASTNVLVGCFSVSVDWSGKNPVVYATTTDTGYAGSPYYGNRVVRIDDTNTVTSGATIILTRDMKILTTVAQPPIDPTSGLQLTNVVYKSVVFTPDLRPVITKQPVNSAAVVGDNVSFSVEATSPSGQQFQWFANDVALPGESGATLTLQSVDGSRDNSTFRCIVSNSYGSIGSSVATLHVSTVPEPIVFGPVQNLISAVGSSQSITVQFAGGTTPQESFQWFQNGNPLSDGPTGNGSTLDGTHGANLTITQVSPGDAGVYSVSAANAFGTASGTVANLTTVYSAPTLIQPPVALTTFAGRPVTNTASAYGLLLTNQWYGSWVTVYKTVTTNIVVYTNNVQIQASTKDGPSTSLSSYPTNQLADDVSYSGTVSPSLVLLNPQQTDRTKEVLLAILTASTNTATVKTTNSDNSIVTNTVTSIITSNRATNRLNAFSVIFGNPGGSLTSAPVALEVIPQPAHTFIKYAQSGQVYRQNFDGLPIPGGSSAEGANPLHLALSMTNLAAMKTNANPGVVANVSADVTYSTDNPLDFGYPILPAGSIGGLGLSGSMSGWYGWAQRALVFAATKGDQSQGAVVDNGGVYYGDGSPLSGITNRALGLIATTKSGAVAFGAAFVNSGTETYNLLNLKFTGELWRNNPAAQPLLFAYHLDRDGTNSVFQPGAWDSANGLVYVPSLDVSFPTSPSTLILDGTLEVNRVGRSVSGLEIPDWAPGTTLWLIWQAQTLGSAQNLAIDDLEFSASALVPHLETPTILGSGSVQFDFTGAAGASYTVIATGDLSTPLALWEDAGRPVEVSPGHYRFVGPNITGRSAQFYAVRR